MPCFTLAVTMQKSSKSASHRSSGVPFAAPRTGVSSTSISRTRNRPVSFFETWVVTAAVISFISLYIYEMPSHHCPFCLLQKEYGYVGYPLYALLLAATVTGLGVGLLQPFRHRASLGKILPAVQRRLAGLALLCYLLFTILASWKIVFSSFSLEGY